MNKRLGLLLGVLITCSSPTWAAEKAHGVKVVSPDRFHLDAGELSLGAGAQVLAAEQQHGMLDESVVQHFERCGIDWPGEVETGDLSGEAWVEGLDIHREGSVQAGVGRRARAAG